MSEQTRIPSGHPTQVLEHKKETKLTSQPKNINRSNIAQKSFKISQKTTRRQLSRHHRLTRDHHQRHYRNAHHRCKSHTKQSTKATKTTKTAETTAYRNLRLHQTPNTQPEAQHATSPTTNLKKSKGKSKNKGGGNNSGSFSASSIDKDPCGRGCIECHEQKCYACKPGSYMNLPTQQKCLKCPEGCSRCESASKCTQCNSLMSPKMNSKGEEICTFSWINLLLVSLLPVLCICGIVLCIVFVASKAENRKKSKNSTEAIKIIKDDQIGEAIPVPVGYLDQKQMKVYSVQDYSISVGKNSQGFNGSIFMKSGRFMEAREAGEGLEGAPAPVSGYRKFKGLDSSSGNLKKPHFANSRLSLSRKSGRARKKPFSNKIGRILPQGMAQDPGNHSGGSGNRLKGEEAGEGDSTKNSPFGAGNNSLGVGKARKLQKTSNSFFFREEKPKKPLNESSGAELGHMASNSLSVNHRLSFADVAHSGKLTPNKKFSGFVFREVDPSKQIKAHQGEKVSDFIVVKGKLKEDIAREEADAEDSYREARDREEAENQANMQNLENTGERPGGPDSEAVGLGDGALRPINGRRAPGEGTGALVSLESEELESRGSCPSIIDIRLGDGVDQAFGLSEQRKKASGRPSYFD